MGKKTKIRIGRPCSIKEPGKQGGLSGLQNGEKIFLKANQQIVYKVPKQAYLIAVIAITSGSLQLGTNDNLIGAYELLEHDVAEVGYLHGPEIPMQSTSDMEIQTIIYKY